MLCSLGVFNAPLMNDAIFKFKRYEDASLTYTGLNKHADDEVGGWDTTIRKTQYEKLFYNQQASMSDIDSAVYSKVVEPVAPRSEAQKQANREEFARVREYNTQPIATPRAAEPVVSSQAAKPTTSNAVQHPHSSQPSQADQVLRAKLEALTEGNTVLHAKFGRGIVVSKSDKFIHVKFTLGEKKFVFPDAFLMGFLEVE